MVEQSVCRTAFDRASSRTPHSEGARKANRTGNGVHCPKRIGFPMGAEDACLFCSTRILGYAALPDNAPGTNCAGRRSVRNRRCRIFQCTITRSDLGMIVRADSL